MNIPLLALAIALLVAFSFAARASDDLVRTRRLLGLGLGVLVVGGLVYHFRALLPPFIVPLVVAYLLDPLLDRLERVGHSRTRAILVVYATLLILFALGLLLVVPPVIRQVRDLVAPLTRDGGVDLANLQELLANQEKLQKGLAKTALDWGMRPEWVRQLEDNVASFNLQERLVQAVRWVAEQLQRTASWLAGQVSGLLWVLLLPITLFYFLLDFDPLRRRLYHLVPPARRQEVAGLASTINEALGSYLRGYAVLSLAVGLCVTTILLGLTPVFQFRYGLLVGLTAGCTYFVPYIGSLTAVFLGTAVVYFTGGHSLAETGITFLLLQGCNSIFDNVISPRVLGGSTGLHPLWVMFALLAGGSQFGLVGVILSTPTAVCVKIVLEHFFPRLSEPIPTDEPPDSAAPLAPLEEEPPAHTPDGKEPDG